MADGLCAADATRDPIDKNTVNQCDSGVSCENTDAVRTVLCDGARETRGNGAERGGQVLERLSVVAKGASVDNTAAVSTADGRETSLAQKETHDGEFLDEMPCSPTEDDCRKKRCVDRYDSSESSDSGVAVLSCTDCSDSSTSSDITDPGSPFSVASSHSEDSAGASSQLSAKMPPTQTAHHPPWSWTEESNLPAKRTSPEGSVYGKRLKLEEDEECADKKSPTCLNNNVKATQTANVNILVNNNDDASNSSNTLSAQILPTEEASLNNLKGNKKRKAEVPIVPKMQQGKITEYFKSQIKMNGIKKELSNLCVKTNQLDKYVTLVDSGKVNKICKKIEMKPNSQLKKIASSSMKNRKISPVSVPRKILPAPCKVSDKITVNNLNGLNNFHPMTLTAVAFPPNLTYLHTKAPKPPDNIFVPQFTAISSDKLNTIPIVNRTTPCLNIIQPIQKFATINNFNNCVKLNATVVPIVKLPSRINGSNFGVLSVETASPTVIPAKPNIAAAALTAVMTNLTPPDDATTVAESTITSSSSVCSSEPPSTPDSDSGISSRDNLEISVSEEPAVSEPPQKSPILSQPKTIRFPAKQTSPDAKEKRSHSSDSVVCQWAKCHSQFDTSGALLEHLQLVHVVPQANQEEQYVCLWVGCKVHGRKSCSRSWLERHVLSHAGTKPFRCIVDGCGMRFNSQLSLERHVNNHFNTDSAQNGSGKKSMENGSVKLFKRNGKKIRFRRQPWSARMFDFIDSGIMEGLQYRLLTMTEKRTMGQFANVPGDTITLQSQVLAKRIEADGQKKVLLRWHPEDIVPDEWIKETEYVPSKCVSIPKLAMSSKNELKPVLFAKEQERTRRKHRRKPCKSTAT